MEIKKVGIVGFGLMGTEIGRLLAQSGYEVLATDVNDEVLQQGMQEITSGRWGLEKAVEKGKIGKEEAEQALERINVTTDTRKVCNSVDCVIEVVTENIDLKKKVFKELDEISPEKVILATNTSSLSITQIAAATNRPDRVIGTHFFQPVSVMLLAEIVCGLLTSDETLAASKEMLLRLGRKLAVVKDTGSGFASIRLTHALFMEASKIVDEGVATPKDVDMILKYGYGHPMGPFEMTDWIGLDMRIKIWMGMYGITNDPKWNPPPFMKQLIAAGYFGDPKKRKGSSGGYYDYFGQTKE